MASVELVLKSDRLDKHLSMQFRVLEFPSAQGWLELLSKNLEAETPFRYSEPRFIGFPKDAYSATYYHNQIVENALILNRYLLEPEQVRLKEGSALSQEDLNRIHLDFDRIHSPKVVASGKFAKFPKDFHLAASRLNEAIHCLEIKEASGSSGKAAQIYFEYAEAETRKIPDGDLQKFSFQPQFGDLSVHYCQVGKTLFDVYHDQDDVEIAKSVRPQDSYSANFTVRFSHVDDAYFPRYRKPFADWAKEREIDINDPKWAVGNLVVAKLESIDGEFPKDRQETLCLLSDYLCLHEIRIN